LIARLAGGRAPFTELKKAGAACFEQTARGKWSLRWLLTSKFLRKCAD